MAKEGTYYKVVGDYSAPSITGIPLSIGKPNIQANNFELKPAIISMIHNSCQFGGLPSEDLNAHFTLFLQLCNIMKFNGIFDDTISLCYLASYLEF